MLTRFKQSNEFGKPCCCFFCIFSFKLCVYLTIVYISLFLNISVFGQSDIRNQENSKFLKPVRSKQELMVGDKAKNNRKPSCCHIKEFKSLFGCKSITIVCDNPLIDINANSNTNPKTTSGECVAKDFAELEKTNTGLLNTNLALIILIVLIIYHYQQKIKWAN